MNNKLLTKMFNTLARKECSEAEIKDKYKKMELYDYDDILEVVRYLKNNNYINDERLCEVYIRSGMSKKWGLSKIKQKLIFDKKVSKELVEKKIGEIEIDESESVLKIVQFKYRNLDLKDPKIKNRAYRHLLSKGFKPSDISKALSINLDEQEYE